MNKSSRLSTIVPCVSPSSKSITAARRATRHLKIFPGPSSENVQDSIEQLRTCVCTLARLLSSKRHEPTSAMKSVRSRSSPILSASTGDDHLSEKPIQREAPLMSEQITVRRCMSRSDQQVQSTIRFYSHVTLVSEHQSNLPNDPQAELTRCLLVCSSCPNHDAQWLIPSIDYSPLSLRRKTNTNERQRCSACTWNHLALNRHSSLLQHFVPMPNNAMDDWSTSESTLILVRDDNDYEPFGELSASAVFWK